MSIPSYLQPKEEKPQETNLVNLGNDGFFPEIWLRDFEESYTVNNTHTESRKLRQLQNAMQETNDELEEQVCEWTKKGYYALAEVPQDTLKDSVSCGLFLRIYRQAVYAKAMQMLNDRYRDTDTTEYAVPKADNMEETADHYEYEYRLCIRKLTGRQGTSVFAELI